MIYAYLGNDIYIYDINSIENDCKFEVYKRIDNGEDLESIELFSFDTETDHISKLIDYINNL